MPFEHIIKLFFQLAYLVTGDYGWAIILLSFAISLLLLPVFILIEKAKKRDDALKRRMQPLTDEIKRSYKGQERYYYLKTLNRQYNYSPLRALIPVLSLLLQIPFFIAAYKYLDGLEALKGVSFLFINDLSQPDGLLGSIHLLPILMTVINLITAWFYTRNGNMGERKQMLVVAAIFLVLLFNLPSGLVLYWTMNNVFSFFRLFITNPEVFKKQQTSGIKQFSTFKKTIELHPNLRLKLLRAFLVLLALSILSQLNWAFHNHFDDIVVRLIIALLGSIIITVVACIFVLAFKINKEILLKFTVSPAVYFSLLFMLVYFYLAGKFYFNGVNYSLQVIAAVILIVLQLLGILYFIKKENAKNKKIYSFLTFLLVFVGLIQLFNLIVLFSNQAILLSFFNVHLTVENSTLADFIYSGVIFILITLPFYLKHINLNLLKASKKDGFIFVLSWLFLATYLFFWNPMLVYASSPDTFNFPVIKLIRNNLPLFVMSFLIPVLLFFVLPQKAKRIAGMLALFLMSLSFVNSIILPLNLGSLQVSRFSEQENLSAPLFRYAIESLLISGLMLAIIWAYRKQLLKTLLGIVIVLNVMVFLQSAYAGYKTHQFFKVGNENEQASVNELKPIPFSKTKPNIVFFVADGFQGWFIKPIMDEHPELKELFEGFTWYPNTVSMANYTHASIPAMLGGYDYSVDKMNADKERTIKQKMHDASRSFFEKAQSKGYYTSSEFIHYTQFDDNLVNNIIPYWKDSWRIYQDEIHLGVYNEVWYTRLYENALFNMVPLAFKPKIYNNQQWLKAFKEKTISNYSFTWYNFIRLLPFLSNSDSEQSNLIYIHNAAAHIPYNVVNDNGKLIPDVTPFENNRWYLLQVSKWIHWMKQNEVYNNTRIILVSDHGPSWYEYDGLLDFESPVQPDTITTFGIDERMYWRLNPLLMVKDFNAEGVFKEDWKLMSNADASYIAFDEEIPMHPNQKNRNIDIYWTNWVSKMIDNTSMPVHKKFNVVDNSFQLVNWKEIE
ncbi:MAG: membrane protein insertase YidC [Salinivirgaceae bacterium]